MHKMTHSILNVKAAATYVPYQDLENKRMMLDLLDEPAEFAAHIRRYTTSLTTQMIFGFRTVDKNDPRLLQLFQGFERWGELIQGAGSQLLDLYPVLQKLPAFLSPRYHYARELHKKEMALYLGHWMNTKKGLEDGTGLPCFCNDVLRAQGPEQMSDEQAAYLSGSLLEAGSDTTASTLVGFVQAIMVFPDVQKMAQDEIDKVVGTDRLPDIEDMESLPYIRACVKESLRWMPTTVTAAPHGLMKDDSYMGYRLPAGATVILNVWSLHMDPKRNPDPRKFDPTRFIDDHRSELEAATTRDPSTRNNYQFGAGRRLCQGMHIAERSLFLGVARLLWAFNFSRPVDPRTGEQKPLPDIDHLVGSLTMQPAPFEVTISPRSEKKALMIRETWWEAVEKSLDEQSLQWKEVPKDMVFSTWMPTMTDI
ncbi:hypothetical protein ASPCAL09357 [Aspergillus calidoustus]|uniref:Cytochrome P450 n=1 Tax=Aspergillus calidoustus TaxID=454130 RepID=A0A0U5GSX8_ASPCI|nr:hypothetical protein ASPCAL09357 [Aspergillus calidoustus]